MGLFKSIKKAFKKVVKGVKKVVKKTVKGIKKVVKKVSSSKILKALAIAAAVVVTGGAAIGAFTGGTATGFAGWMMNASNVVTSGTLFGTGATGLTGALQTAGNFATSTIAKPFASLGATAGNVARGVTDFTRITQSVAEDGTTRGMFGTPKGMVVSDEQATNILSRTGMSEAEISKLTAEGSLTLQEAAQTYVDTAGGVGEFSMANLDAAKAAQTAAEAAGGAATEVSTLTKVKDAAITGAVQTGIGMAGGYIAQKYFPEDPQGQVAGLEQRFAQPLDPLKVYAAEKGIADFDITKYFTFGNTPDTGNIPLYRQDIIAIPS
tara:strand:- start:1396 stop:2361 length:966 start_codon:yes stop_codon:yes gene_type:complete